MELPSLYSHPETDPPFVMTLDFLIEHVNLPRIISEPIHAAIYLTGDSSHILCVLDSYYLSFTKGNRHDSYVRWLMDNPYGSPEQFLIETVSQSLRQFHMDRFFDPNRASQKLISDMHTNNCSQQWNLALTDWIPSRNKKSSSQGGRENYL